MSLIKTIMGKLGTRDNWKNFSWWLLITVGAGLAQVWILLLFISSFVFFPAAERQFGPWGVSRILGNSVLLFFATSLLGQTIYSLSVKPSAAIRGPAFLWFFLILSFVAIFILYIQTVLWRESTNNWKFMLDILFAVQVLAYAGYVEFKRRRGADLGAVQEERG